MPCAFFKFLKPCKRSRKYLLVRHESLSVKSTGCDGYFTNSNFNFKMLAMETAEFCNRVLCWFRRISFSFPTGLMTTQVRSIVCSFSQIFSLDNFKNEIIILLADFVPVLRSRSRCLNCEFVSEEQGIVICLCFQHSYVLIKNLIKIITDNMLKWLQNSAHDSICFSLKINVEAIFPKFLHLDFDKVGFKMKVEKNNNY